MGRGGKTIRSFSVLQRNIVVVDGATLAMQDLCFLDLDCKKITLKIQGEGQARGLFCHLFQPGEGETQTTMTPEEVEELFVGQPETEPGIDAEGDFAEDSMDEDVDEQDDAQAMELANLLPPRANDPGDGLLELGNEGALVMAEQIEIPGSAFQNFGEGDFDEEDYVIDEELFYEPCVKHQHIEGDVPVFSGLPSSAANPVGYSATPAEVRSMLPNKAGVKIQHRSCKSGERSAGWQCWYSAELASRWFSYGSPGGKYSDREAALQQAIEWLWMEDKKHSK